MTVPSPVQIWTGFHATSVANGGDLRAAQIAALCAEVGCQPELIQMTGEIPLGRRLCLGMKGTLVLRRHGIPASWRSVSLTGYTIGVLQKSFASRPTSRLLIWESVQNPLPALMARRFGRSILALPQNVESFDGTLDCLPRLRAEGFALRWAQQITCIAQEDRWFWANLGLSADFLPYYPTAERCRWLGAIAARRAESPAAEAPWLILGTAHNPPTLSGMRAILTWAAQLGERAGKIWVAGGGTEQLRAQFERPGVRFLGSINEGELANLLAEARALIVHQEAGSGALTRIPEAICAGLPVIANAIAARSTRDYPGVEIYENQAEFHECLGRTPRPTPAFFIRPLAAERRFQSTVLRLAQSQPPAVSS